MNSHIKLFEEFSQGSDIETVRDLAKEHTVLWNYDFKIPESDIDTVLSEYGYELKDKSLIGEYSDLKGYLDAEIIPIDKIDILDKKAEMIKEIGKIPDGVDVRQQGEQIWVLYYGKNPKAKEWAEKAKEKYKNIGFTDTSKM